MLEGLERKILFIYMFELSFRYSVIPIGITGNKMNALCAQCLSLLRNIFPTNPWTILPLTHGSQSGAGALRLTNSCLLDDRLVLQLVCTCANRCLLHLLSDNMMHSAGRPSAGWGLISDIWLSCAEHLWFTFTESAYDVIISEKSLLTVWKHLTLLLLGWKKQCNAFS